MGKSGEAVGTPRLSKNMINGKKAKVVKRLAISCLMVPFLPRRGSCRGNKHGDVTKCYKVLHFLRHVTNGTFGTPYFCAKFAEKCHARGAGVEREISRAVEARTFGAELNGFRDFGGGLQMG